MSSTDCQFREFDVALLGHVPRKQSLPDHLPDIAVDSEQFREGGKETYLFTGHLKR